MVEKKSLEELWLEREGSALQRLHGQLKWFHRWTNINHYAARSLSVIVLVCAVFAPLTVASSAGGGIGVFGVGDPHIRQLAMALTIVLALAEGIRRIFRFEQRYATCVQARENLRAARDAYLDKQIDNKVGDSEWIKNLQNLRSVCEQTTIGSIQEFISVITAATQEGAKHRKGPNE